MCFWSENVDFLYGGGVRGCRGGRAWLPGGACVAAGGGVRGCWGGHAWLPGGCHVTRTPPPVNRITDRCKNITFAQTTFAGGNKCKQM